MNAQLRIFTDSVHSSIVSLIKKSSSYFEDLVKRKDRIVPYTLNLSYRDSLSQGDSKQIGHGEITRAMK